MTKPATLTIEAPRGTTFISAGGYGVQFDAQGRAVVDYDAGAFLCRNVGCKVVGDAPVPDAPPEKGEVEVVSTATDDAPPADDFGTCGLCEKPIQSGDEVRTDFEQFKIVHQDCAVAVGE